MSDFRAKLNPQQFAAVTATEGPVLVIAGAGSGKTRVIEYRVLHLIEQGVPPHAILLLTFTRKAAREMLSRATQHNPEARYVEGGTFHSFALKTLHRYGGVIGLKSPFTVLDESDSEEAIHRVAAALKLYEREKRFPKKDTLRGVISAATNTALAIREVLEKSYPQFVEHADDIEKVRDAYLAYKVESSSLDYDDLLLYLKVLLEEHPEARRKVARRFRYIMVDEYQDTNHLQADILCALAGEHRNVMVVGDDAQSIYRFRGATHENIMRFPQSFPGCRIIALEENYRSTQRVLDTANAVLENMTRKYEKRLLAATKREGVKPELHCFPDAREEAAWIAAAIKELRDGGTALEQIGVLFRSSFISIPLQAELTSRDLPYQVFGGIRFYETAHVKDIVAYLRVLANRKDALSWRRVLLLLDGVGPRTADELADALRRCASWAEAVSELGRWHGRKYGDALMRLGQLFRKLAEGERAVGEQFDAVWRYYKPFFEARYDDYPARQNDLEVLRDLSRGYGSLEEFLMDFAVEPPDRARRRDDPASAPDEPPLTLSTIHSAKGLEWRVVFLLGVADGMLPSNFSFRDDEDLEEEHRLLYVALTRAMDLCYLTFPADGSRSGVLQFNRLSRFLDRPNVRRTLELPTRLWDEDGDGVLEADEEHELIRRRRAAERAALLGSVRKMLNSRSRSRPGSHT